MTCSFCRATGLVLMLLFSAAGLARIDTYQFSDSQQEDLYHELTQELRCLVCQNQNIADSNAELAKDLRRKTYEMVVKGQDKDQIVSFMVERYGDFVMYKPPFKASTIILWLGPGIILVLGVVILIRVIRRRPATTEPLLSEEQRKQAEKLLGEQDDDAPADKDKDRDQDSTGDK